MSTRPDQAEVIFGQGFSCFAAEERRAVEAAVARLELGGEPPHPPRGGVPRRGVAGPGPAVHEADGEDRPGEIDTPEKRQAARASGLFERVCPPLVRSAAELVERVLAEPAG